MNTDVSTDRKRTGRPPVSGNLEPGEKTPQRQVRIPDDIWYAAAAKASAEGTTSSAVIRRLLAEWLEG